MIFFRGRGAVLLLGGVHFRVRPGHRILDVHLPGVEEDIADGDPGQTGVFLPLCLDLSDEIRGQAVDLVQPVVQDHAELVSADPEALSAQTVGRADAGSGPRRCVRRCR